MMGDCDVYALLAMNAPIQLYEWSIVECIDLDSRRFSNVSPGVDQNDRYFYFFFIFLFFFYNSKPSLQCTICSFG